MSRFTHLLTPSARGFEYKFLNFGFRVCLFICCKSDFQNGRRVVRIARRLIISFLLRFWIASCYKGSWNKCYLCERVLARVIERLSHFWQICLGKKYLNFKRNCIVYNNKFLYTKKLVQFIVLNVLLCFVSIFNTLVFWFTFNQSINNLNYFFCKN